MKLQEMVFWYLIKNDPVRANLEIGESMRGILFEALDPFFRRRDVKHFRTQISQALSTIIRVYGDPEKYPCFYRKKVNGKYEIISTDSKYAVFEAENIMSEYKPRFLSLKKKLILNNLVSHKQAKQLIDVPLMKIELALGTREKVIE